MIAPESNHSRRFRDRIVERLGLRFEDEKLDFLTDVLEQRTAKRELSRDAYLNEIERGITDRELQALIEELTVPETYFFRHVEQFRAYADVALPAAQLVRGPAHRLQVLSVGCASGEEPYSLAMWARDHGARSVDVLALDVNPAMLAKAMRGVYTPWALRETPADLKQRWFCSNGAGFELDSAIRNTVTFRRVNLAHDEPDIWTPHYFDVIFCRNVLMYFTVPVAQAAVARMTRALAPHGHLFLGHAETMRGLSNDYHLCHTHDTFYYQRKDPRAKTPSVHPQHAVLAPPMSEDPPAPASHAWPEMIRQSSDRIQALSESFSRAHAASPALNAGMQARSAEQVRLTLDLMKQERFADALTLLSELPPGAELSTEEMLLRAVLLTHGGQLRDAEQVSAQILELDALNAGAHYLLALCRESAGDLQGALDHDEAAIDLDADFAMPQLHLGLMARRGGDWSGARSALGKAMPLLEREDAVRVLLFGGGFGREGLMALCRAELHAADSRA